MVVRRSTCRSRRKHSPTRTGGICVSTRNFGNPPQAATLVCTETFWNELRGHLLKRDGKERVAFSLLGRAEGRGRVMYYGHRLLTIPDERCVEQHPNLVEPDPAVVVD